MLEYIVDHLEEEENVSEFFLDLTTVFKCLSHDIILVKLKALGFEGNVW